MEQNANNAPLDVLNVQAPHMLYAPSSSVQKHNFTTRMIPAKQLATIPLLSSLEHTRPKIFVIGPAHPNSLIIGITHAFLGVHILTLKRSKESKNIVIIHAISLLNICTVIQHVQGSVQHYKDGYPESREEGPSIVILVVHQTSIF